MLVCNGFRKLLPLYHRRHHQKQQQQWRTAHISPRPAATSSPSSSSSPTTSSCSRGVPISSGNVAGWQLGSPIEKTHRAERTRWDSAGRERERAGPRTNGESRKSRNYTEQSNNTSTRMALAGSRWQHGKCVCTHQKRRPDIKKRERSWRGKCVVPARACSSGWRRRGEEKGDKNVPQ